MKKIAVLFTCYNRIEKTRRCINSLRAAAQSANCEIHMFITDGGSSDGTLEVFSDEKDVQFCINEGAFYSQGMLSCMKLLDNRHSETYDYIMLVNDDVNFYEDFLVKMLEFSSKYDNKAVIAGATCDSTTEKTQTYGGIRYVKSNLSVKYETVLINDSDKSCDTFNANCVLIPGNIYNESPRFDKHFIHGLGDFDYGMCLKGKIVTSDFFVGTCDNNSKSGTWMDTSLSVLERIKKLNSVKGSPTKQWFYYLRKHFGVCAAVLHSISPYIRILIGK